MLEIVKTKKDDPVMKIVKREQEVISDQYDQLKGEFCDRIDEMKDYHANRLAMLADILRHVK